MNIYRKEYSKVAVPAKDYYKSIAVLKATFFSAFRQFRLKGKNPQTKV